MKILLIHTYYQQKGGEDAVFEQDCSLLSKQHEVVVYRFQNKKGISGAFQFLISIWNISAARKIKEVVAAEKPDIVHIHNTHFASGPLIIRTIRKMGIPVTMTLHNFRMLCPSATLLHNNRLFTDSISAKFPWAAIRRKVYRNSYTQTFWLAFINWFHRSIGTWDMCNKFLVLTNFSRQVFLKSQMIRDNSKYTVHPNCISPVDANPGHRGNYFLFIGRLSKEKGIDVLLKAFNNTGYELRIGGDGPLRDTVKNAALKNKKIKYLGNLTKSNVLKAMRDCTALIFPSICYEGMPMTILEAFSSGTPVIASDRGAMAEMISQDITGLLFTTGVYGDLQTQLEKWASLHEIEKMKISENTRREYEDKYTSEIYTDGLLFIYNDILLTNDERTIATNSSNRTPIAYDYR